MVFLITIGVLPVGGPAIRVSGGIELEIDSQASQWDVGSVVEVAGGWSFLDASTSLPGIPAELPTLWQGSMDIPEAGGPLPTPGAGTARWSQVYDIANDDEPSLPCRSRAGLPSSREIPTRPGSPPSTGWARSAGSSC